jgi:hypothetical protein
VRQNIAVMEKKLPPKLDIEILKQLAIEELVETIIDQGKSRENLTNRVVEMVHSAFHTPFLIPLP